MVSAILAIQPGPFQRQNSFNKLWILVTPTGPADLAVQAVVVDKEDCPELPREDA